MPATDEPLTLFYGDPELSLHTFAQHALAKQVASDLVWAWPGLNARERLVALVLASRGTSVVYGREGVQTRSHPYKLCPSLAADLGLTKGGFEAAVRGLISCGLIESLGGHHYCLTTNIWAAEVLRGDTE